MGGYELVRSDDALPATAVGADVDLEAGGATAAPACGGPKRRGGSTTSPAPARQRLVSLDVFRGITVLLMIIVDDAGAFIPVMNHSPWDGVTVADFVMPFFLFIVGVALALAYKRVPDKLDATKKAVLRALKLFCLGLVLQGGFFHGVRSLTFGVDLQEIRLMGILQRIAIAYLLTALCEIWLKGDEDVDYGYDLLKRYRYQLFVGAVVAITYMSLLYGTYVPDWDYQTSGPGSMEKSFFVKCGVRGDTSPGCNAVGMIIGCCLERDGEDTKQGCKNAKRMAIHVQGGSWGAAGEPDHAPGGFVQAPTSSRMERINGVTITVGSIGCFFGDRCD